MRFSSFVKENRLGGCARRVRWPLDAAVLGPVVRCLKGMLVRTLLAGLLIGLWLGAAGACSPRAEPEPESEQVGGGLDRLGRDIEGVILVSDAGVSAPWGTLNGKPRAVFFGFTHCPVICPVTVWELNHALEQLGPRGEGVEIQFISIDPQRDTPERLLDYFSGFDGRIDAFTGAPADIARLAQAFEVVYARQETDNGYTMDHTATVFLLDADGAVRDVIGYGSPPETVQARLDALIAASERR